MTRSERRKKKSSRRRNWRLYLLVVCVVVFIVSGAFVLRDLTRSYLERRANEALAQQVDADKDAGPTYDENGILMQYSALYHRNPDMAGWLKIDGTEINYPVMYSWDRKEYYLRRNFDREYAVSGTPFIDEECRLNSNHLLIYGHHMKNGSMFGSLPNYADESYAAAHRVINFDTLTEQGRYEVLGAFYSRVYNDSDTDVFRYYQYEDLREQARFEEYVSQVKEASLYDTGVQAHFGDTLLTLSTCSYHTSDGRFVVVARKI